MRKPDVYVVVKSELSKFVSDTNVGSSLPELTKRLASLDLLGSLV